MYPPEDGNNNSPDKNKNEEEYVTEDFDKSLVHNAVARIKKLATGNGISTESIKLKDADAEIYVTNAVTILSFESHLEPIKKPDKNARLIEAGSQSEVQKLHKERLTEAMHEGTFKDYMRDVFGNQRGYALAANEMAVPISRLTDIYMVRQTCPDCEGAKNKTCPACGGQKQAPCRACNGGGRSMCPECDGRGQLTYPGDNQPTTCRVCDGMQMISCRACSGSGISQCTTCNGQGQITCNTCGGKGEQRSYAKSETIAVPRSAINPSGIPDGARKVIAKHGIARIAKSGQIDIKPITKEQPRPTVEELEMRGIDKYSVFPPLQKDNEIQLLYNVKIPYGRLKVEIDGKQVDVRILGNKGMIADMPAFLNTIVSRETQALERSIKSGAPAQILKTEVAFRFIQSALALFFEHKPKKAMALFAKEYGLAIDRPHVQALFHALFDVTTAMTKKTRILSGLAGLFSGLGLIAAAWYYKLNSFMSAQYDGLLAVGDSAATDFVVLVLTLFIAGNIAASIQKILLKKNFEGFPIKKVRQTPKAGIVRLLTPYILILSYFGLVFSQINALPLWIDYLKTLINSYL